MSAATLQEWIAREKLKPAAVLVRREGSPSWRTAADFGLTETVAY
jgi:hypothetical protein